MTDCRYCKEDVNGYTQELCRIRSDGEDYKNLTYNVIGFDYDIVGEDMDVKNSYLKLESGQKMENENLWIFRCHAKVKINYCPMCGRKLINKD